MCIRDRLIQVGIVGTVFCRFSCSPIDKNKIVHNKLVFCSSVSVHILKLLRAVSYTHLSAGNYKHRKTFLEINEPSAAVGKEIQLQIGRASCRERV